MAHHQHVRLVDADTIAAVLDVPSHIVLAMFRDGRLPGYQLSKRRVRFEVNEVIAALRAQNAAPVVKEAS